MRTEVQIRFAANHVPGGAAAILGPARCGRDVARVEDEPVLGQLDVWVTLEESDPRIQSVLGLLKQHGVDWSEWHEDRYTEEELDSARLLFMHPNRQCEIDGGVEWGMTYDLSEACPKCGTGGRQTSAALVDGEKLAELEGHRAGATWFGHVLVDERLAKELDASGATGLYFRNVYAVMPDKRQVQLRWKQLCAHRTLPRMSVHTTGLTRNQVCELCGRNGYFRTSEQPTRIVYRASSLRDTDDANMSWENMWFAELTPDLRDSLLSWPWIVVTPKVRRIFRDAGVTSFDWLPVRVEDD